MLLPALIDLLEHARASVVPGAVSLLAAEAAIERWEDASELADP
jgi:hypothetical protein